MVVKVEKRIIIRAGMIQLKEIIMFITILVGSDEDVAREAARPRRYIHELIIK